MYEYLKTIPLVDTHVHRLHPDRDPEFGQIAGGYIPGPGQQEHARQTILYSMMMDALRQRFGMPADSSDADVEAERFRHYNADPAEYSRMLLNEGNVALYCFEIGSPLRGKEYTKEEASWFSALIPKEKQRVIVRIERSVDEVRKQKLPFSEFLDAFQNDLCSRIEKERAVALKSSLAYYGGLNYTCVERAEAETAYERLRSGCGGRSEDKQLYIWTLLEAVEIAVKYDLPIQIHTGAGGGNYLDFCSFDPVGLTDFLRDKRVMNRVKIILLHGGHPHEEDTSFLTAQFSNVYTDFSGTFFLTTLKGPERMMALLERTPLDKVMYGSDGVMFPETSWFAADYFRRRLGGVLEKLVADGYLRRTRAEEVGRMILHDNAFGCYTKLKR